MFWVCIVCLCSRNGVRGRSNEGPPPPPSLCSGVGQTVLFFLGEYAVVCACVYCVFVFPQWGTRLQKLWTSSAKSRAIKDSFFLAWSRPDYYFVCMYAYMHLLRVCASEVEYVDAEIRDPHCWESRSIKCSFFFARSRSDY